MVSVLEKKQIITLLFIFDALPYMESVGVVALTESLKITALRTIQTRQTNSAPGVELIIMNSCVLKNQLINYFSSSETSN